MITESFQEYKTFIIRLRSVTNNGFSYDILRQIENENSPNKLKNIYLRQRKWTFILPDLLLQKAKNYIDDYNL